MVPASISTQIVAFDAFDECVLLLVGGSALENWVLLDGATTV